MTTPLFLSESLPLELRNVLKALEVGMPAKWGTIEGEIEYIGDEYLTICVATKEQCDEHCFRKETKCCVIVYQQDWDDLEIDPAVFQYKKAYRGKTNDHPGNEMLPPIEQR
mgnify:FL=1|jgi:hypothetical protein|tara:strand:- start:1558 stop:1890 length:333 start_codon:yes stop_codon:yes gene_type:complete